MCGGTDGAVLSARGIPTPNVFTGAYNFHTRFAFAGAGIRKVAGNGRQNLASGR
jgi:hypothetical protein